MFLSDFAEKHAEKTRNDRDKELAKAAPALLELAGAIPKFLESMREVRNLMRRLEQVEADLANERSERERLEKEWQEERKKFPWEKVAALEEKIDNLENRERRNNLIFFGLEDARNGEHETWDEVGEKVKLFVREKLGVGLGDGDIVRAHRLGKGLGKPVIAKFANWRKREEILTTRKKLAGSVYYIKEDFSRLVREKRRALAPRLKEAREGDQRAKMVYDCAKFHV